MHVLLAILTAAIIAALSFDAEAAPPPKGAFSSPNAILKWINGYRSKPQATLVPDAVRAMSTLGIFRDADAAGAYVGFIAGVLGDNPNSAEALVTKMFPLPPEEQVVLVRAIAYSGLKDWKALLVKLVERMPARKVLIQRHLDDKAPTLATLSLEQSPAAMDTLWGYYFATGRFDSIQRIVTALEWAKERDNVERLTIGSMAKWMLANNAQQDKELLDYLKRDAATRPKAIATELREVIEAAETFETAKIRKDALASIEDLKRKGPQTARNASFWGQAGQTALALGCVVAGALGHVEIGIPCIIGGAASSAALKFIQPQ